ncbi:hypothetical protein M8J76_002465 [Diaphorina citri]|nr:hypothetical protein M8J76_002465 [Diaphorina citri]
MNRSIQVKPTPLDNDSRGGESTPASFSSFLTVPSSFSSSLSSSSFIFFFSCYSKFSILYFFLFHFLLHPPFPD